MSTRPVRLELDLAAGETYPLLVNALSAYATVLDMQSREQAERDSADYSDYLARVAAEARQLVATIEAQFSATRVRQPGA